MTVLKTDNLINRCHNIRNLIARKLIYPGIRLDYHGICDWYLLSLFILPSYFGVRLAFFDLTAFRFFEILLIICIWKDYKKRIQFITMVKRCPFNIFIGLYIFVIIYTNLYHPSLGTIFYWIMNGISVFYLVSYLILTEYGIGYFIEKLKTYTYILTVISPLQLVLGKSPFHFLDTLGKISGNGNRFGYTRILGNWWEANGYAMYLCILLPLLCWDGKNDEVNLLKNKSLILLTLINVFLTGSRLSVGTSLGIMLCCYLLQKKSLLKKSALIIGIVVPFIILIAIVFKNISLIRSLWCTFFSAFDEVFNTNFAINFGADAQILYDSSHYRTLLFENTILDNWLNPIIGQGGSYQFAMYIDGYDIQSCDNFYVGQYIAYAWPGVIVWLIMSCSFFITAIKNIFSNKKSILSLCSISIIFYFISLWYLDHLQTFMIMFSEFAIVFCCKKNILP